MNRIDDFDQTLSAWLRGEAPPQAPDRVLDAALGRVASQAQQRRWVQLFTGGTLMPRLLRAAAVTAALALAVLVGYELSSLSVTVGPSQAPSASPSTAPSASPTAVPSPSGGPLATQAAPAALLLRLDQGTFDGALHVVTVLDDGRVIITRDGGATRVERVLTADGLQLLRDVLQAPGLTDRSGEYMPVANPGVEPPGHDGGPSRLEITLPAGEIAVISWYLYSDTPEDYFKPQPEAEALEAVAARLATLNEWLPETAWAEAEARPYVPAQYRIYIFGFRSGAPLDQLGVETSAVSWPLVDGVNVYGNVVNAVAREKGDAGPFPRCRIVGVEEGAAVIAALQQAGAAAGSASLIPGPALELGYRANRRQVVINLEPILPFAETSCGREISF